MSEILVDNLTGKTSAGDITVTSEGGAATQSLQQGLAKSWFRTFFSSGTPTSRDSFNIASYVDVGTGKVDPTFTNAMDNANYVCAGNCHSGNDVNILIGGSSSILTTKFRYSNYDNGTFTDTELGGIVAGDLA
jgi:hypothetical protein